MLTRNEFAQQLKIKTTTIKNEGRTLFWDVRKQKQPSGKKLQADLYVSDG
jgi:hypothetical protein